MAKEIDVYREWLGVSETARPLNYYQLLRLKAFEDDQGKIREHYRKMNAHVRKFADGEYAQQAHDLLGELAKAMLCLTDVVRKEEYDASLGRQTTGGGRRRSFEEILLANKSVDQAQLAKARSYAQAVGLEVREALVQQKAALAGGDDAGVCGIGGPAFHRPGRRGGGRDAGPGRPADLGPSAFLRAGDGRPRSSVDGLAESAAAGCGRGVAVAIQHAGADGALHAGGSERRCGEVLPARRNGRRP